VRILTEEEVEADLFRFLACHSSCMFLRICSLSSAMPEPWLSLSSCVHAVHVISTSYHPCYSFLSLLSYSPDMY